MFDSHFDPYDLLMELIERMQRLEQAHNSLAEYTQRDLSTALYTLQDLQRRHVALLQRLTALERESMNAQSNTRTNIATQEEVRVAASDYITPHRPIR